MHLTFFKFRLMLKTLKSCVFRSYDDIVTLREIDEELISLTQRVFLEGVPKAAEEDEEEEDSVPSKAPKKIRRSHLQKKKGRATVEVSAASKKSKQPVAGNKVKGVNNLGKSSMPKKGSMAGLLVLRPKAQEDGDSLPPLVVGRSSKQNERVTFELGRDHHLWFHVQVP